MNHVHEIKRGAWGVRIIDRNAPPRNHRVAESIRWQFCLDHPGGYLTSWPIHYGNGGIGWEFDNPPRDARRAMRAAIRWTQRQPKGGDA